MNPTHILHSPARRITLPLIALALALHLPAASFAQGTAFTYQGNLSQSNAPVTGPQDFEFRLFNAATGGAQQGPAVTLDDLGVTNGLFTATLDFGAAVFPGADRFLQIAIRPGASTGAYTNLNPRQPITSTPYAIRAANLTGTLPLSQLPAGVVTNNSSGLNLTGIFTGNGAGLSNVNAATLGGLTSAGFWRTNGNVGANPTNGAFLGTADNLPLEFRVNGQRVLRLASGPTEAPNVIAGAAANSVGADVDGATIAGGGINPFPNSVLADYGTVGGGSFNLVSGGWSTIAGGRDNQVAGYIATIAGGLLNQAGGDAATVGGGDRNAAKSIWSTIGGGRRNLVDTNISSATIAGGEKNTVQTGASYSCIGGGLLNSAAGEYAAIPGGLENSATTFAFAAGRRAKANHTGVFAWADSTDADFSSTAANQFLVRASGGVGLGTGNPQAPLHLYSANNPATLRLQSAGGFGAARLEFFSDPQGSGTEWRPGYIQSTDNGGFTGGLSFHVNGTGFDNRLGDLEVMRIVDGRVGINTPNPLAALEVSGGAYVDFLSAGGMNTVNLTSTGALQVHNSSQNGDHTFTGNLRQMITLGHAGDGILSAGYGLGLQTNNFYFRSEADFSWFRGGSHRDTPYDPGSAFFFPGAELMRLSGGYLQVNGTGNEQAYLGGDGAGGDIEIGSRNPAIGAVALWNAGSGQQMDLFARSANCSGNVSFGAQTRQMLNLWGTAYGIGVQASTLYFRCNAGGPNEGFSWYKGGTHNDNYANPGGGTELMHLVAGGLYVNGAFVSSSDRNAKENLEPVDTLAALEKVVALPLSEWSYKADTGARHIGPMAQDFRAAFGLGHDDKGIATVDADGVALAAIQGLHQLLKQKDGEVEALKKSLADLQGQVAKLNQLLNEPAQTPVGQ
jgi:hypothetical protein